MQASVLTDAFVRDNLMGPNAVLMVEELCDGFLPTDTRHVCDLGCGSGLTSIWLAEHIRGSVCACDLWNTAEANQAQFDELGLGQRVHAVQADALALPFTSGTFDALVSVDSYNYFGRQSGVIDRVVACVQPGNPVLLAVPGLVRPLDDQMMEVFGVSWTREQMEYLWTANQWHDLLSQSAEVRIDHIGAMACFEQAWADWLACDNDYARGDCAAMRAGADSLMNLIAIRLTRK